jgi:anti-sigma factor RsiW
MKTEREKTLQTRFECAFYSPRLSQYFDGNLSTGLSWRIKNHIAVCASCAETVLSFSSIASLLGSAERYEVSKSFDVELERRIASFPKRAGNPNPFSAFFSSLLRRTYFPANRRRIAAPLAAAVACIAFVGIAVQQLIVPNQPTGSSSVIHPQALPDSALVQACLNQHRSADTADPLDDTSAILLTTRVDSLPVSQSNAQSLSDDDAAVLLDEGI